MQLYCHFSETSCGTKGMIKYSKLTKGWIWNRTTVSKFIGVLCSMGVAEIQKVGTEKFVSVKPSVLQWFDCSDIEAERHRDDPLLPQATPHNLLHLLLHLKEVKPFLLKKSLWIIRVFFLSCACADRVVFFH
ncbi:hypothetical protein DXB51_28185 [Bacillus cereus]|nr:hypothetical protein DXB51_28185 [Bacillus cereus]